MSFVTVALRYDGKPALLKLLTKVKIFKHESKEGNSNFSLGIQAENNEILSQIEKRIRSLASSSSKEIKKLDLRKVLHVEDLRVLKTDASGKEKVFGNLYSKSGKIRLPSFHRKRMNMESQLKLIQVS